MAGFDFPNSPTPNQIINGPGGTNFKWDGVKWIVPPPDVGTWAPLVNPANGQNNYFSFEGGTLTGPLFLSGDATQPLGAVTLQQLEGMLNPSQTIVSGPTAPSGPSVGDLWYDTVNHELKTWDGSAWIPAVGIEVSGFLPLTGGVLTGGLVVRDQLYAASQLNVAGPLQCYGGVTTTNLGVTGTATVLGDLSANSLTSHTNLRVFGDATVNGATTLNTLLLSSGQVQGSFTVASLGVTTNATVNGTTNTGFLGVTGNATINAALSVGTTATINALTVSTNANIVGTTTTGALTVNTNANVTGTMTSGTVSTASAGVSGTATIGTLSVTGNATVTGTGSFAGARSVLGTNGLSWAGSNQFGFIWSGGLAFLYVDNTQLGWVTVTPSDVRLKRNIRPASEDALASLRAVELVSFDMDDLIDANEPAQHTEVGVTAQQIRSLIPEAVAAGPRRIESNRALTSYREDEITLSVKLLPLVARCIGAIQQLATRLEVLETAGG